MICIIAGNHKEAAQWAAGQNFMSSEWFYPEDLEHLKHMTNFHVIVIGTAGENVPASYFERVYQLALTQGRKGR